MTFEYIVTKINCSIDTKVNNKKHKMKLEYIGAKINCSIDTKGISR